MRKIIVAGIGPGSTDDMTTAVKVAIQTADVIVGYKFYFQFIRELLSPTTKCIDTGMKRERERAERAFELAETGRDVVVISSGDAGIYGMASLIYEMRQERQSDVSITVLPGISAPGGNTTLTVGDQSYKASGGAGGISSSAQNTDGGAVGGAGSYSNENGGAGRYLFDDSTQSRKGGGGGGAYLVYSGSSSRDSTEVSGSGGAGGGTSGSVRDSEQIVDLTSADASDAGGSGGCIGKASQYSANVVSGKGGAGFVAFRKAV